MQFKNYYRHISLKWSGIYETCVMPHLIIPVIKELFGITTKNFEVTDKAKKTLVRQPDIKGMSPYLIMLVLSIIGIARICTCVDGLQSLGLVVLVFWIVRNMYYLIMALFLVDGRESDTDNVRVADAEFVVLKRSDGSEYEYFQVLYDRVPTLPQSLTKDFGMFTHLFRNIAHRILR